MSQTVKRQVPGGYRLRVNGHLDQRWSAWFDDLTVTRESDGTTSLRLHHARTRRGAIGGPDNHVPGGRVTTSIIKRGDAGSPHRLLPFNHAGKQPGDSIRVAAKGAR